MCDRVYRWTIPNWVARVTIDPVRDRVLAFTLRARLFVAAMLELLFILLSLVPCPGHHHPFTTSDFHITIPIAFGLTFLFAPFTVPRDEPPIPPARLR